MKKKGKNIFNLPENRFYFGKFKGSDIYGFNKLKIFLLIDDSKPYTIFSKIAFLNICKKYKLVIKINFALLPLPKQMILPQRKNIRT